MRRKSLHFLVLKRFWKLNVIGKLLSRMKALICLISSFTFLYPPFTPLILHHLPTRSPSLALLPSRCISYVPVVTSHILRSSATLASSPRPERRFVEYREHHTSKKRSRNQRHKSDVRKSIPTPIVGFTNITVLETNRRLRSAQNAKTFLNINRISHRSSLHCSNELRYCTTDRLDRIHSEK